MLKFDNFFMVRLGFAFLAVAFSLILVNNAYAQTSDTQVTLSGDLQNNPVVQDILKKIEKSKKWIKQIQQRDFEQAEKQKELEQKRAEVLTILQDDLKKWEKLWNYYTFDSMLERALKNNPANSTDSIYDHPLKFTASKINAGRNALQKVLQDGGRPEEARDAFVNAAKITRAEMLSVNSIFNVINNNAYYNQQILFDSDGNFNVELSGEELRKYYQDYRTNPEYLQANPLDKISWEDLGKNTPATKCRSEYVIVYRTNADDYVCTTEYTAEMWIRHNMGTIVTENFSKTQAIDIEKLEKDRIAKKIINLNSKVQTMQNHFEKKMVDTKSKYELLFVEIKDKRNYEEKQVIAKFDSNSGLKDRLSKDISAIREKYSELEETLVDEQSRVLTILEQQYSKDIVSFAKIYELDSKIDLVWELNTPVFEASLS
jgi:ribosomal protein S15P/S13E